MALRDLGVPFEYWKTSEWEVNAVASYKAIHFPDDNTDYVGDLSKEEMIQMLLRFGVSNDGKSPMAESTLRRKGEKWLKDVLNNFYVTHNLGSILNIHAEDLEIDNNYTNILTYSFPCFVEGTLVMTSNGYKEIQDIEEGEYVLTHTNKWQKVVKTMINEADKLISINCMPSEKIHCTPEHPFYVRRMERRHNPQTGCSERYFYEPEWVKAKDLDNYCYVGTAINQIEELPTWDGIDQKKEWGHKTHVNTLQEKFKSEDFWYIIGRYIGDGWLRTQGGIIICGNGEEIRQITPHLENLEFGYTIIKDATVYKIHISFQEIGEYCKQFGRGASNKHLTSDILNLPVPLLKSFLSGYMDADGTNDNGKFKATSVSRRLIYELAQCINKVYHRHTSIYYSQRPKTYVIEGRTVNQKDTYQLTFTLDKRPQDHAFYEDGYIWSPIKTIEEEEYSGLVYNLEVENDNSYQIQNVIVHNCQDLSLAGHQKGMSKGSETRSGLLWEVERLLNECKEKGCLPDVLLMENVTQVRGKKNLDDWNMWVKALEDLGYHNYVENLNAKNYGVAQNRDRCFMVSLLSDEPYVFPEPIELQYRLKDYLEDSADEKYFINNEKSQKLIKDLLDRGVLPQKKISTALLTDKGEKFYKYTDISGTLMARSYKGFGNQQMEGVIENYENPISE